ncbi:MAG: 3,4-dihydroxy-2-butanone-4-phosphate synthase, partial [Actinomycetota bacterium]
MTVGLGTIEEAIAAISRGEMVVVVDDEDRENEGDLIMAAQYATQEAISFFISHTSGLICVAVKGDRLDELELPLMVANNTESQRTAFTVSVDYRHGTTTGISAHDRSATIRALADRNFRSSDFVRPGHIFPLRYKDGGVLKRAGHTEASVDLAIAAGLEPAGVLCEIVTEDKSQMARADELKIFSEKYGLVMISIAELVRYRRQK